MEGAATAEADMEVVVAAATEAAADTVVGMEASRAAVCGSDAYVKIAANNVPGFSGGGNNWRQGGGGGGYPQGGYGGGGKSSEKGDVF